ncbi:hypothetical protein MCOR25_009603 [Pyricularia grisea]|uniref:Uncharacterized protein n=1 Tax=Pyricularia grisea TaxID=148305 RepID=A0A6P8AQX6_PYRGI|nr:uncharacterized protein PgNI_12021 [Pyricularia grisea]KAI6352024.1 hypothetical protein MCOR25_009603 [Pyricularia grisea]TLD04454.1 hypothetical protein PgNI_12021 [Pyricularia grisea]
MSISPSHHDAFLSELFQRLDELSQLQAAYDADDEASVEPSKPELKRRVTLQIPAGHGPSKAYPKSPPPELDGDDECSSCGSSVYDDVPPLDREIVEELAAQDEEVSHLQAAQDLAEAGGEPPKLNRRVTVQIPAGHCASRAYPRSPFPRPQDALPRLTIPNPALFVSTQVQHDDALSSSSSSSSISSIWSSSTSSDRINMPLLDARSPMLNREMLEELAVRDGDEDRRRARAAFVRSLGATGALSLTTVGLICWPFVASKSGAV